MKQNEMKKWTSILVYLLCIDSERKQENNIASNHFERLNLQRMYKVDKFKIKIEET